MQIHLRNEQLSAVIESKGSELVSLQRGGQELLWDAGPEWARHAPVLFPVIGRVTDDVILHKGRRYPMNQHGFARDRVFTTVSSTPTTAHFHLQHSPRDGLEFPFPFSLETRWHLDAGHLAVAFTLTNTGDTPFPAALGWHPAFRTPREQGWKLLFEHDEKGRTRRVNTRVQLTPEKYNSPLVGTALDLSEELLAGGAIIFESLRSRTVQLVSAEGPVLTMEVSDEFPHFAVWKKPGAGFVCLEPWSDLPHPDGERHDTSASPGKLLMPGERRDYMCRVSPHVG